MRAELAGLNHRAVSFLRRDDAKLCWHYYTCYTINIMLSLIT